MNEASGNLPNDPHVWPPVPAREPVPGNNGPVFERVPESAPLSRPDSTPTTGGSATHPVVEEKDAFREIVETVVFVVVLVLLLKAFMAEAFVIPTGSMATTLFGYNRQIECPECGFRFPLNLSKELDGTERDRQPVVGCTCPNCYLHIDASNSNQFQLNVPPQQP